MGEPIKIVVTAETAEAAAAMQAFLRDNIEGLTSVSSAAGKAGEHMGGMVYQFRSAMDAIRFAAMDGGPRAAFYAVDEAIRGVVASGMKLGSLVPYVAAVTAAAGGAYLVYHSLRAETERQIAINNELTESYQKQADTIKLITEAAKGGAISGDERQHLLGMLGMNVGQQSFAPNFSPSSLGAPTANAQPQMHGRGDIDPGKAGIPDKMDIAMVNQELEKLGVLLRTTAADGKVTYTVNPEIEALSQLTSMRAKYEAQMELSFDKQRARAQKQHDEEMRNFDVEMARAQAYRTELELRKNAESNPHVRGELDNLIGNFSPEKLNDAKAVMEQQFQDKLTAIDQAEQEKRARTEEQIAHQQAEDLDTQGRLLREQIEQTNREITTELELEKKQNEEREKAARLEQEIARAKTAASLELIKGNPQLTEDQKRDQSLPLMQTQSDENQARLSQLSGDMANPASSDEARLDAEKQYYDLKVKEAQLQNQINAAQNASNFGAQFADVVTKLQNINTLAQSCAQVFGGAVNTAVNSISTNISGVIMGTKTWKQALTGIYNAIVTDIVQGLVHMAVQWALQHVIMSAISSAFHIGENAKTAAAETTQVSITSAGTTTRIVIRTGEAAHDAAMTGVQVATHAAGETTKTGWTFMHAVMRNASRLFETIFHGIMTALRTAVHIVGETTATGVTMAQSLIRATAYLITAAVGAMQAMANIPYVGPVLAIVAAAAIIGAGVALMAGFEKGGYTGNTNRNAVAGVVHGGEFVMDASTVDRVGVQNLEAIRSGRNPDTSAPSGGTGGGSKNTSVYAFLDPRQMADHLERNDDHEKWVVDVMGRNIHKFR